MIVRFVLLAEGPSDAGLVAHLERMCIAAGAHEVSGVFADFTRLPEPVGRTVTSKLAAALALEPNATLFFIHRDADSRSSAQRHAEIAAAVSRCGPTQPVVAVVPVQESEAWLLVDEDAIRRAVGNQTSRVALALPNARRIEHVASPKEVLETALITASELTGRRLKRLRLSLPTLIRALLSDLPLSGAVEALPSWRRLRDDTNKAIAEQTASHARA